MPQWSYSYVVQKDKDSYRIAAKNLSKRVAVQYVGGYCDSTGSRVPILPGTDSTGFYRVLLLYTTVGLSYRRSHLQRPLRS